MYNSVRYVVNSEGKYYYDIKTNTSNEITIRKIKDNYTREEVVNLIREYHACFAVLPVMHIEQRDKWIEENL